MKNLIFLNGKFVKESDAKISVFDRGFMYGDGIFETMRSYSGIVFEIDRHIERLFSGLRLLKIKHNFKESYLKSLIFEILLRNNLKDAYIKLIVSRGKSSGGIDIRVGAKPSIVLFASKLEINPAIYRKGIKLYPVYSARPSSVFSQVKSLNYLENILLKEEAKKKEFDDALFLDIHGNITEATTSNIFFVKKDELITPPLNSGILPGITRETLLDVADSIGLRVCEKNIVSKKIGSFDEAFVTNSILEVVPVVKIGGVLINKGRIGKVTKNIHLAYKRFMDLELSKFS